MERSKKCLICYSSSEAGMGKWKSDSCFGNNGKLADETLVIFVVRSLLKVPSSVCERFLKNLGNPSDWRLTFCGGCQELLNDAKEVAKMIYALEGKLNGLRNKIQMEIHRSYKEAGEPPRRNFHKHLEALDEIRYCVANGFEDHDQEYDIAEAFEDDFEDQNLDNDSNYSDIDYKEEIGTSQKASRKSVQNKEVSQGRRLRARSKPKPIKLKKEINPGLFITIVPTVVPLNDYLNNEAVDPLGPDHQSTETLGDPNSICDRLEEKTGGYGSNFTDDNEQERKQLIVIKSEEEKDVSVAANETREERYLKLVQKARFRAERKPDGRRIIKKYTDSEKPFKCPKCKSKYASQLMLSAHINKVHKGLEKPFICELCHQSYNRRANLEKHLRAHVRKSKSKKFSCSQCRAHFLSEIRLDVHIQRTHLGNKKPLACQLCERKFERLYKLEEHLQEVHEMTVNSDDVKRTGLKINRKRKEFKCSQCVRSFNSEDVRYSHIQRKHNGVDFPFPCTVCGKGFIWKNELEGHMRKHERTASKPTEFICEACGKRFSTNWYLKFHVKSVHENQHGYICEICSKLYKTKKSLVHHQATMHLNDLDIKHFECEHCKRTFGSEVTMKVHVDQIHNNIYPFRCSFCNKGCISATAKSEHENIHTGAKPHMCEICGRSFAFKKHLSVHMRIHTGVKPYHCDTCGQDFLDRTWFKRHQELHTGIIHNCHICGKGFPIKHNLGIHMKSHANKNGRNNKQLQN